MTKSTTYGQKGGEGPTRGRKAETIEAIFGSETYRKRVFFGQRWMTFVQNENGEFIVSAWESEERANKHLLNVPGDHWPVQLVTKARVV